MDYVATYPSTTISYHASDIRIYFDSEAAYLILPNARNCGASYFYLSHNPSGKWIPSPKYNGPVLVE